MSNLHQPPVGGPYYSISHEIFTRGYFLRTKIYQWRQSISDKTQKTLLIVPMMPKAILYASWVSTFCLFALFTFTMPSYAAQEPDFRVVKILGEHIELREYASYVVAEVVVPGPAEEAGKQAFPILAGYIFGKNKGDRKFAMTAPVTQTVAPVKLEMTAPVTQVAVADGYLVQFVLPREVTLSTAPEPLDARIMVRSIGPSRVAAIRYSGFWSEANDSSHLATLQAAVRSADLKPTGAPIYSRYNAPFTPWFMRRNEIWLHLVDLP